MLKEILAITGKPGLFKIVSHGGKTIIVEDMTEGKKFPISARDRIVSLGDIAMYTENGEKPLGEILDIVYEKEKGAPIEVKKLVAEGGLKEKFEVYVPDYDRERVHDSDVKKLFNWYNLLIGKGYTKFAEKEEEQTQKESDKESDDQKK